VEYGWAVFDSPFQVAQPRFWSLIPRSAKAVERPAADQRAERLLLSVLPPEQAERFRKDGCFEFTGSLGGKYRIRTGRTGNVERLAGDEVVAQLCGVPERSANRDYQPVGDVLLGQYLALVTDEAGFIAKAEVMFPQEYRRCGCPLCR
jgi:hypothetical protein